MKKVIMCMSLVCVVVIASEKKSAKIKIENCDQLHDQVRRARAEFNQDKGESFLKHIETKSTKINTERSRLGDTNTSEHQK